jgi:hypothetical protein
MMPFLECDDCGGYYELEEGESLDDFDVCQCGGELKYFNSLQNFLEDNPAFYHQNNSKSSKKKGGFGSRKNSKKDDYEYDYSYGNRSLSKNNNNFAHEQQYSRPNISKPAFLERISFVGLFAGLCLTISSCLISYVLFFDYLYLTAVNIFSSTGNIMTTVSILGFELYIILFVISVSGGALASFIGGSRSYGDGLLNGFLMGLLIVIVTILYINHLMGMSLILMAIIVMGSIFVSLTSFGGFSGIAIRKLIFKN